MIEIKTYFAETAYKHEYYNYKFSNLINSGILTKFWIVDDEDAIEKFKELVLPYNDNNPLIDVPNNECFIYLCNYLNDKGYYIEEFPKFLERPTAHLYSHNYKFSVSFLENNIFV